MSLFLCHMLPVLYLFFKTTGSTWTFYLLVHLWYVENESHWFCADQFVVKITLGPFQG